MKIEKLFAVLAASFCLSAFAEAPYMAGKAFYIFSQGSVARIEPDGKLSWRTPKITQVGDIWVTTNSILYTCYTGIREITYADHRELFKFTTPGDPQTYGCQRLPNGNYLLAECINARLLEIDPAGKVAREIKLAPGKAGHGFMRGMRFTPQGTYLVSRFETGVKEYDSNGKVIWEYNNPALFSHVYNAVRMKNGNVLLSCGEKAKSGVFEITPDKRVVWSLNNADLAGQIAGQDAPLKFPTGFFILPNGNLLLSNWLGHGFLGQAPELFEITRDKKIVWTWADHKNFPTISSVYPLDADGKPLPGESLH
jgi:hypothetical protein